MNTNFIKKTYLFLAGILFISCLPLPIGFYTITRLVVFISMIILMINFYKINTNQVIILGLIAIIFNPIFTVYLNSKILWVLIDLGLGIYFLKRFKEV